MGASIEQKHKNTWHTIAFSSRFLNEHESRYSTNELELLAVVWSLEHFKHYFYGTEFTIQTDHRALLSALNENRGNKTYQSRLTKWVDRLLPFNFKLEHIPGKNMGFGDYLSRHPKTKPPPPSEDDIKYIINLINDFIFGLTKNSIESTSANRTQTDNYQPINNATNNYPQANNSNNAFCLNSSKFKSPSITSNSTLSLPKSKSNQKSKHNSNFISSKHTNKHNSKFTNSKKSISTNSIYTKNSINPQGQINVTTRNRPRHNTFDQQIPKRKRSPNKPKTKMSANQSSTQTIATQTEDISNKGRGRSPIRPDPSNPIFTLSSATNMPQ